MGNIYRYVCIEYNNVLKITVCKSGRSRRRSVRGVKRFYCGSASFFVRRDYRERTVGPYEGEVSGRSEGGRLRAEAEVFRGRKVFVFVQTASRSIDPVTPRGKEPGEGELAGG